MKIAVTSLDQKVVTGPACSCPSYFIYEIENGGIKTRSHVQLTKPELLENFKGFLSRQPHHPLHGIQCLITANLGNGMNRRLNADGIRTIATNTTDPDGAVLSVLKFL